MKKMESTKTFKYAVVTVLIAALLWFTMFVVKPMNFAEFMKTVKLLGVFWAATNEPPPQA